MGADNLKCQCACNKDEKLTEKFEETNKIINQNIENSTNNVFNDNIREENSNNQNKYQISQGNADLSSPNELKNFVRVKENKHQYNLIHSFPNKMNNISSGSTKYELSATPSQMIKIQALFRGYSFRKTYPSIKKEQIEDSNQLLKELTEQYTKFNLKRAESLYGVKFNKNGWKSLYSEGDFDPDKEGFNYDYGRIFNCRLLIIKNPVPSFYVGNVNINYERHEYGILLLNDGSKYEGYWRNSFFTGWGRYIDSEGTIYEGNFQNGRLNGKGLKRSLNGNLYIGDFIDSRREGKGKEETNEHIYEGEYKNDKKNGSGKLTYKLLKDTYEGEFLDNNITGTGFYTWGNKDIYKGGFVNGKMHGKGLYKWPDGGEYYGDYVNNIKEGNGIFKWTNEKVYEGQFKRGKPCGFGKLRTRNREIDVEFKDGKLITDIKRLKQ